MCVRGWYQTQGTRQWYRARITRQHVRRSPVRKCPLAVLAMITSVHTYIYYRRRFQKMPNSPRRICCDGGCFVTLCTFPGIARPRVSCHRDSASSNHPHRVGLFAPFCPTVANFLLFELPHQLHSQWPDLTGASSFLVGSWISVAMAYDLVHPERDPGYVNNSRKPQT